MLDRNNIIARLQENDSTVLSFPDRGPWGDNRYRGNCSGWYHAFLIWKYRVTKLTELFSESGTGYDVAQDMGIRYAGADLNPTPARPGILCVDAVHDEVPVQFTDADFVFMHPPYGAEIQCCGTYTGWIAIRKNGSFSIKRTDGKKNDVNYKYLTKLQCDDGYSYVYKREGKGAIPLGN